MGWLWSSSSSIKRPHLDSSTTDESRNPSPFDTSSEPTLHDPAQVDPSTSEPPLSSSHSEENPDTSLPPRKRTRDEIANSEFLLYLKAIQARSKAEAHLDDNDDDEDDDLYDLPTSTDSVSPRPLLTPRHLYPSSVSCQQFFELSFKCQSPGGQILHLYRYGTFRSCAQHWNNFWWCMRTNHSFALNEGDRAERVRRRYWEQDQRVRARKWGCSEDVWRQRKERVVDGWLIEGQDVPDGGKGF